MIKRKCFSSIPRLLDQDKVIFCRKTIKINNKNNNNKHHKTTITFPLWVARIAEGRGRYHNTLGSTVQRESYWEEKTTYNKKSKICNEKAIFYFRNWQTHGKADHLSNGQNYLHVWKRNFKPGTEIFALNYLSYSNQLPSCEKRVVSTCEGNWNSLKAILITLN